MNSKDKDDEKGMEQEKQQKLPRLWGIKMSFLRLAMIERRKLQLE